MTWTQPCHHLINPKLDLWDFKEPSLCFGERANKFSLRLKSWLDLSIGSQLQVLPSVKCNQMYSKPHFVISRKTSLNILNLRMRSQRYNHSSLHNSCFRVNNEENHSSSECLPHTFALPLPKIEKP